MVPDPARYPWSSASTHIAGINDDLVNVAPLLEMPGDWPSFLQQETTAEEADLFRLHGRTGRPLGSEEFITHLEKMTGRRLRRVKPGPKNKHKHKGN
ncbi:MAG: hypothetical protein V1792_08590 [Pseudomonadota bacterium]